VERFYLAENIRFWKEEETNDSAFAFSLSSSMLGIPQPIFKYNYLFTTSREKKIN
jgi:hypothetical protein